MHLNPRPSGAHYYEISFYLKGADESTLKDFTTKLATVHRGYVDTWDGPFPDEGLETYVMFNTYQDMRNFQRNLVTAARVRKFTLTAGGLALLGHPHEDDEVVRAYPWSSN